MPQNDTTEHRQVLPLSARTPDALAAYARTMSAYLREHDELDPAAVAATLQWGRSAMEYRASVAFRTVAEAAAALDGVGEPTPIAYSPRGHIARVRFALPGTGDQFPGMGRGLYESEPAFREALDRCAELARVPLGMDLRTALFTDTAPAAADPFAALRGESASESTELTTRTDLAHASVFALNYAAAQLWLDYGIEPDALLGYSLGEYSAACLAGVLELEAAVPLVVRRARLIAEAAPSGMLTVATSADRVGGYLTP
ncbi:acyltransferase domain-containing protein, partial [Nocardia gipuzkoensis]